MKNCFGTNWNGDVEFLSDVHAEKSRCCDADYFHRMTGQVQRFSNGILLAAKMIAPKTVTQNDGAAAASLVVAVRKQTSGSRTHAEGIEVISADKETDLTDAIRRLANRSNRASPN